MDQANPRDPLVAGGAVLSLALLGIAASAIQARCSLAVDPSKFMHEEGSWTDAQLTISATVIENSDV